MSKTKMLAAKELIDEKRYDEARILLRSTDHPKAAEWLEILDRKYPSNTSQIQPTVEPEVVSKAEDENLITPNHERHGRYPKAVAGEFDGIEFRSQLEIRFAAELKKRHIAYEYEPARIGKGNYMIDFHLPDKGIWVEVKGKMDARDEFMLQECSQVLRDERNEALYVYSNDRKMHLVQDDKLEYLWPGKFWDMLEVQ